MAVTFLKKFHTCTNCGKKDYELLAIKSSVEVSLNYASDRIPAELKEDGIYTEQIARDEFGIILFREAREKLCDVCGTTTLSADKVDNQSPVLNFYPRTEAHKWLDGLGKAGL